MHARHKTAIALAAGLPLSIGLVACQVPMEDPGPGEPAPAPMTGPMAGHAPAAAAPGQPELGQTTTDGRLSPRLQNLGDHTWKVTTDDRMAQTYFNQGLVLTYGFNHAEARRSFQEVARIDPQCAMAAWGEALVLGPNINAPMGEDAVAPAWEALQRAIELRPFASPKEQALIDALATRYAEPPRAQSAGAMSHGQGAPADRSHLDAAYADAMRTVAQRYPDDADVQTLFAEAIMDVHPWDYWTPDGRPRAWTAELLDTLDRALAINPRHPGATHLYIHACEASRTPERAEFAADALRDLDLGTGHLVHMPSHIYVRVGRYDDATAANEKATLVDEDYITQCRAQGIYPAAYYPHNIHFLWMAETYRGRSASALAAARKTDMKGAHSDPIAMQQFAITPLATMVRFAMWDQILQEPDFAEDLLYARGFRHYARGMAFAAAGDTRRAEDELAKLEAFAANPDMPEELFFLYNTPATVLTVGTAHLAGEIAMASGDLERAIAHFSRGVRLHGALAYNEPPDWAYPLRHALGAALLEAGRPAEAESVYWDDLADHPENGWALFGLTRSLEAQGRDEEAARAKARFEAAWDDADTKLTSSRW